MQVWSSVTPDQDAKSGGGASASADVDPTAHMKKNTNTATGSVTRSQLARTSDLIQQLRSADQKLKKDSQTEMSALKKTDPKAKDGLIWADKAKIQKSAATTVGKANSTAKEVAGMKVASAAQGARLTQTDKEAQAALLAMDAEIKLLGLIRYHWLVLDYGPAREYMLSPYEFGHLSYHSALGDTMGDFSRAEVVYNDVHSIVSSALSVVSAIPYAVNGLNNLSDVVKDWGSSSSDAQDTSDGSEESEE